MLRADYPHNSPVILVKSCLSNGHIVVVTSVLPDPVERRALEMEPWIKATFENNVSARDHVHLLYSPGEAWNKRIKWSEVQMNQECSASDNMVEENKLICKIFQSKHDIIGKFEFELQTATLGNPIIRHLISNH